MASESRVRAHNKIKASERAEQITENCADGKHVDNGKGKCKHCAVKIEQDDPEPKPKTKPKVSIFG
jgi:hypothetical protein